MIMKAVVSSNIESIGYEAPNLYVKFKSGETYKYFNVPENIYNNLMNASSHGTYLNSHIKNGGYKYVKL